MLDNSYIKVHDARFPKDIADDPGKKAKELGGHQQYLTWKAKQDKQSNWETIPAKRWLTILVLTNLFTAGLPILIGLLQEPKSTKGSQLQQEIQALRDSVQELLHQPKETLYIRQNPLSQSKSDCIK